eukprot:TRINITY_DN319_c0_g2_i1.p1 TRINITY_DN319_c0_g2~~TRINITY_DN319_c0_g2_i1.p1  ORF type:complete len:344 (+),score=114.61 TRINITY_DN319_c0_g2_i1:58-1089(+)
MAEEKEIKMPYKFLGRSGLKVSVLSYGTWVTAGVQHRQVMEDQLVKIMERAYEAGINFFDNAETYANGEAEIVMGRALKRLGWRRSSYVVSTKLFWGGNGVNEVGLSRKHIVEGINASLERLQLDYVDVLFCHRPDPCTPLEETCRAMDYVINSGKAFYWGTSEWSAADIEAAMGICRELRLIAPICEQPQYSMLHRQRFEHEYAPLFKRYQLGTTIWSPLAMGVLTGKYNDGIPADSRFATAGMEFSWQKALMGDKGAVLIEKLRQLGQVAVELECTPAQLALAWCLLNPNVTTVILGASKLSQLEDNLGAIKVLPRLTPEVVARIEQILDNKPEPERVFRS